MGWLLVRRLTGTRHPVLGQSEVWAHFLACTDEKRWKSGKRKAEKDPLVGGALYSALRY